MTKALMSNVNKDINTSLTEIYKTSLGKVVILDISDIVVLGQNLGT